MKDINITKVKNIITISTGLRTIKIKYEYLLIKFKFLILTNNDHVSFEIYKEIKTNYRFRYIHLLFVKKYIVYNRKSMASYTKYLNIEVCHAAAAT